MSDRPPPRRAEFDAITMGWGSDDLDDLTARIELAAEWTESIGGAVMLSAAEAKIVTAMIERQVQLGINRGDFEPHIAAGTKLFGKTNGE